MPTWTGPWVTATTGKLGFDGAGQAPWAASGWGFGQGLRAEVEFGYRSSGVGKTSAVGYSAHAQLTGTTSTSAVMAKVFYNVPRLGWRLGVPVTPQVELSAGYAWSAYDRIMIRSGNDESMTSASTGASPDQAILGLDRDLSSLVRSLSLSA
ncbi:hypothetical protein E2C06_16235 [Dankookia rubra]|uniref:Uncharacterized protein n=1 Tax=Dankookia rubra TaxID=1442381 RepID=A0A4R5QET8_9PROT|nr:hypothetical protein [Dankookia rubra]TDH61506.1 hypothetical protein E2C06_16235 [Dankookia rubra]